MRREARERALAIMTPGAMTLSAVVLFIIWVVIP
jgi:hypothetical protein